MDVNTNGKIQEAAKRADQSLAEILSDPDWKSRKREITISLSLEGDQLLQYNIIKSLLCDFLEYPEEDVQRLLFMDGIKFRSSALNIVKDEIKKNVVE